MFGPDLGARMVRTAGSTAALVFDLVRRHGIACDAIETGWIQPSHSTAGLAAAETRVRQWRERGADVALLSRERIASLVGTNAYRGGWIDRRGGTVQPLSYARGLATAAARAGARVFARSGARRLRREGESWVVETDAGEIRAEQVVLGTNGYTGDLWPRLKQSVVPVFSLQVATKPLSDNLRRTILPEGQAASDTLRLLRYYRLDRQGRFVLGARGPFKDADPNDADASGHYAAIRKLFPQLDGVPFEFNWSGRVAMTADHLPHLHELAPGLHSGLGYNGRGVGMATMMGRLLAERASGTPAEAVDFPVIPLRPLPLHGWSSTRGAPPRTLLPRAGRDGLGADNNQERYPMRLSDSTLNSLRSGIGRPAYDRAGVTPGIVHLGIGAFFRAHGAAAVDECLAAGEAGWGIVAASLRSRATRDALAPQDGLYTLALRDTDRERLRVIGSIGGVLVAPEAPEALLAAMTDPRVKIVSMTVTEKGYAVDLGTGGLRADHPDILHDLEEPDRPRSMLGFVAEALTRRRRAGVPAFTVLSCDNLPQNGRTLHRVLTEFAAARDPDLGRFVADHVACPCVMVDRIVPATTDCDRAAISASLGLEDAWPVLGEPFFQWVIEDRFPTGRPTLERGGAEFVDDVEPFEHMKLRLLNGAHSTIAAIGRLAGYPTVAETIRDPAVRRFIETYWEQVIPTLGIGPAEAHAYTRRLLERFDNIALQHKTAQIASDASQKIPQRILAALRDRLAAGAPADALVFAVAAWIRSCGGTDERGEALPLNDPTFQAWSGAPDQASASATEVIDAFLGLSSVFGPDLPADAPFRAALRRSYETIRRRGVIAAIGERSG